MVYLKLVLDADEITHLASKVEPAVFSFWHVDKGNSLYGIVKDSAYELFIVACSLSSVKQMECITNEQFVKILSENEPVHAFGDLAIA